MKKIVFILSFFFFQNICFSQTSTYEWYRPMENNGNKGGRGGCLSINNGKCKSFSVDYVYKDYSETYEIRTMSCLEYRTYYYDVRSGKVEKYREQIGTASSLDGAVDIIVNYAIQQYIKTNYSSSNNSSSSNTSNRSSSSSSSSSSEKLRNCISNIENKLVFNKEYSDANREFWGIDDNTRLFTYWSKTLNSKQVFKEKGWYINGSFTDKGPYPNRYEVIKAYCEDK